MSVQEMQGAAKATARPSHTPERVLVKTENRVVFDGPGDLMTAGLVASQGVIAPPLVFPDDSYLTGFPSPLGSAFVTNAATQPDYYPVAVMCNNTAGLSGTIYLQEAYLDPQPPGWPGSSPYRQTVIIEFNDGSGNVQMPILDYVPKWNTWGGVMFVSSGDPHNSSVLNVYAPGSKGWTMTYGRTQKFTFKAVFGDTIAIIGIAGNAWSVGGGCVGGCYYDWDPNNAWAPIVTGDERNGLNRTWCFAGGDTMFQAGSATRSLTYTVMNGTSLVNGWKTSLMLGATIKAGVLFDSVSQTTQIQDEYSGSYTVTKQTTISQTVSESADPNYDSRAGVYQLFDTYDVYMPRTMSYFNYITNNRPSNTFDLQLNGKPVRLSSLPFGKLGLTFQQPVPYQPTQNPGGAVESEVLAFARVWKYCSATDSVNCKPQP